MSSHLSKTHKIHTIGILLVSISLAVFVPDGLKKYVAEEENMKQHITWVDQLLSITAPPSEKALCQVSATLSNVNKSSPMISWTSFKVAQGSM